MQTAFSSLVISRWVSAPLWQLSCVWKPIVSLWAPIQQLVAGLRRASLCRHDLALLEYIDIQLHHITGGGLQFARSRSIC